MMTFWQYLKLLVREMLNGTRAEFHPNPPPEYNTYEINGVRYMVTTCFSKSENKTLKEKISAFIGSDFAHLTNADDINTMNTEYVNSTAGEGRINAVR